MWNLQKCTHIKVVSGGVRSEGFEVWGNLLLQEVSAVGKSVSLCTFFRPVYDGNGIP